MANQQRNSLLCPNCRRLISSSEEFCPHCGLKNPGARWRTILPAETLFGGDNLVRNLIVVNAAMYILSIFVSPGSTGLSMNPFSFLSPGDGSLMLLGATGTIPIDRFHRWWTVISANYLHGSILHILFNMMALRQIAPLIIQEYGRYRTLSIFTLSGVGGYLISYYAGVRFTIGASAAVCGLIGAALYYGRSRGGYFGQMVYQQLMGWVIGMFAFGFLIPGINNWAHGGGLLFGIASGFVLGYLERKPETSFDSLLAGACLVATLFTLVWAVGSSILILASS